MAKDLKEVLETIVKGSGRFSLFERWFAELQITKADFEPLAQLPPFEEWQDSTYASFVTQKVTREGGIHLTWMTLCCFDSRKTSDTVWGKFVMEKRLLQITFDNPPDGFALGIEIQYCDSEFIDFIEFGY
jgi:hypothetical protein